MINNLMKALLRWRWLIIVLLALTLAIAQLMKHRPDGLDDLDPNFLGEALVFGLVFPLIAGILLNVLARTRSKLVCATSTSTGDSKDGAKQRVLIVENESLLGAGVESLLIAEVDLILAGLAPDNKAELIEEINHFQPDVVILDEASYLINSTELLAQLKDHPKLRVVVVSADDNSVQIYNKQRVLTAQGNDLATVVRGSYGLA